MTNLRRASRVARRYHGSSVVLVPSRNRLAVDHRDTALVRGISQAAAIEVQLHRERRQLVIFEQRNPQAIRQHRFLRLRQLHSQRLRIDGHFALQLDAFGRRAGRSGRTGVGACAEACTNISDDSSTSTVFLCVSLFMACSLTGPESLVRPALVASSARSGHVEIRYFLATRCTSPRVTASIF